MDCLAVIIVLASLASFIHSSSSTAFSGNGKSPSRKDFTETDLSKCPNVSIFLNLQGDWLTTYAAGNELGDFTKSMVLNLEKKVLECGDSRSIAISGFLKDNLAKDSSGDRLNKTDGEAKDWCKRNDDIPSTADSMASMNRKVEENLIETRKSSLRMQAIEDRLSSIENTLASIKETLSTLTSFGTNQTMVDHKQAMVDGNRTIVDHNQTMVDENRTIVDNKQTMVDENRTIVDHNQSIVDHNQTMVDENRTMIEETEDSSEYALIRVGEKLKLLLNVSKFLETQDEDNDTATIHPDNSTEEVRMQFDANFKGRKVVLSTELRNATRTSPLDDDGEYGGVVSNVRLREDEVFQIRIEKTVGSWNNYGISIGVLRNKKADIKRVGNIHEIKGTWAIHSESNSFSGTSDTYKNGKTVTKNGYPLDTRRLQVGSVLGVSRRKNGNIHFYLNGVDKGLAFEDVPNRVYAFVDVINYVSKISIVD